MPEIDSLTVRIEADLSGLRRGLREAEQLVAQSSRSMVRSLAGVEGSLRRIGDMSATLQPPVARPERKITARDRVEGAFSGLGTATLALALTGPVTNSVGAATLLAGMAMGAFTPDAEALLSNALSEPSSGERLTELENRISQLQSMQGIETGMGFGDAIREKELAEKIGRLQLERSELLRQIDRERERQDNLDLSRGDIFGGSEDVETLIGAAGEDALRAKERIEDLDETFEGARISTIGFAETQSNALDILVTKSEEARASALNLNNAAHDLGFTFASSFEDAVVEGKRLSDVLQGLEQDILRILTRKLVTEPLAGAVTGLIGTGVGALAGEFHGGGRVGSTAIPDRVVPASFFAGAPRFVGGGMIGRVPRLARRGAGHPAPRRGCPHPGPGGGAVRRRARSAARISLSTSRR